MRRNKLISLVLSLSIIISCFMVLSVPGGGKNVVRADEAEVADTSGELTGYENHEFLFEGLFDENQTVSTMGNGRPRLLIFTSSNPLDNTFQNVLWGLHLSNEFCEKIDVVCVFCWGCKGDAQYAPSSVTNAQWGYSDHGDEYYEAVEYYSNLIPDSRVSYNPLLVYIDVNNRVQRVESGYNNPDNIQDIFEEECGLITPSPTPTSTPTPEVTEIPTPTDTPVPTMYTYWSEYSYNPNTGDIYLADTPDMLLVLNNVFDESSCSCYKVYRDGELIYTGYDGYLGFFCCVYGYFNVDSYEGLNDSSGYLPAGEYRIDFCSSDGSIAAHDSINVRNTVTSPSNTPTPIVITSVPSEPFDTPIITPTGMIVVTSTPTAIVTSTPTAIVTSTPTYDPAGGVDGFAERLYTCALNREYDPAGKKYWADELRHGSTGAYVAEGFFFSSEIENANITNREFVHRLYLTFMDREPAASEMDYWMIQMNGGMTRREAFGGFIHSTEWANVCVSFGILSGGNGVATITVTPSEDIIGFATRLYTTCLGRAADSDGLEYWSYELANLRITGSEAARMYFFSEEFINKEVNDLEFIDRLYLTFMDRNADTEEIAYWITEMTFGMSRETVFSGFALSEEFGNICAEYGIIR